MTAGSTRIVLPSHEPPSPSGAISVDQGPSVEKIHLKTDPSSTSDVMKGRKKTERKNRAPRNPRRNPSASTVDKAMETGTENST